MTRSTIITSTRHDASAPTRISCACGMCTRLAKDLGQTELAAEITELGIAHFAGYLSLSLTRQTIHDLVYRANDPELGASLL